MAGTRTGERPATADAYRGRGCSTGLQGGAGRGEFALLHRQRACGEHAPCLRWIVADDGRVDKLPCVGSSRDTRQAPLRADGNSLTQLRPQCGRRRRLYRRATPAHYSAHGSIEIPSSCDEVGNQDHHLICMLATTGQASTAFNALLRRSSDRLTLRSRAAVLSASSSLGSSRTATSSVRRLTSERLR